LAFSVHFEIDGKEEVIADPERKELMYQKRPGTLYESLLMSRV
jgi:hypothetical protein